MVGVPFALFSMLYGPVHLHTNVSLETQSCDIQGQRCKKSDVKGVMIRLLFDHYIYLRRFVVEKAF
jgi:hypothetical protein